MKHKFFWVVLAVILVSAGVLFLQGEEFSRVGEKSGDRQAYLDRDTESTETLGTEESTQEADRGFTYFVIRKLAALFDNMAAAEI